VKKALTSTLADAGTPVLVWALLGGELAIGSLLLLSGRLPMALVRSLQLFLRF
jgi:hypothetical protein